MTSGSFGEYLAGLGKEALAGLLRARPDVRVDPVPRGFEQLAQRLSGPDSLAAALRSVDRDAVVVGQAVAALESSATVAAVARLLDVPEQAVQGPLGGLYDRGLAWCAAGVVHLPERLGMHWSAEIGGGRPAASIARSVLVDDLRAAVEALGVGTAGLSKPALLAELVAVLSDGRAMAGVVRALPKVARDRIDRLRDGYGENYSGYGAPNDTLSVAGDRMLIAAGLVLRVNGRWEMPTEVGVAAWLAQRESLLTGRPELPRGEVAASLVLATSQVAISDVLRAVTMLLDQAESSPIVALKKGGVGLRERSRLAGRLAQSGDVVALIIDVAFAAGLLGRADVGYVPTDQYRGWRAAEPARRWAVLATTWFAMEHAPTSREAQGDKESPPPLPLVSAAGGLRRALLRAASGGFSVRAAGGSADWFFPVHECAAGELREKVAAAVREAELLGVVAADVVSGFGQELVAIDDDVDVVGELARRVAGVLVENPGKVILQSDLTAVVSGQLSVAASLVLGAAAVSEARRVAGVWRFSPGSVGAALDAGWTAPQLLGELAALSELPVPQPLEYLITDVARRHGAIRVRGMRSCVVADETMVTEILHTSSLAKLQLAQVAPTVLSSPFELDVVLARLRAAGLFPVAEDELGAVIVEARPEHRASVPAASTRMVSRDRVGATELAERLLADPSGEFSGGMDASETFARLAELSQGLDDAELTLLADAIEQGRDVLITYRNKMGNRTIREIQPRQLYGRWVSSWCYLRDAEREFTVANIESVAPAG